MTAQAVSQRVATRRTLRAQRGDAVATTSGPWRQAASVGAAIAWRRRIRQVCWAVVMVALVIAGLSLPAQAQVLRNTVTESFDRRFTTNDDGEIYIIGNTLFSCFPVQRISDLLPRNLRPGWCLIS